MNIDLNNPQSFTLASVAQLIASKDDSQHRQLRVTSSGIAFLSDDVGNSNTANLAFRLETWCQGNGYTGIKASQDAAWVQRIFNCLSKNWPTPTSTFIDFF